MEHSNYQPSCSLENALATTPVPNEDTLDPSLRDSDMYIWATNVYPVYISSEAGGISAFLKTWAFKTGESRPN